MSSYCPPAHGRAAQAKIGRRPSSALAAAHGPGRVRAASARRRCGRRRWLPRCRRWATPSRLRARRCRAARAKAGWRRARHGRRTRMTLTEPTAGLLGAGAERIYSFGDPWEWDGRWLVVVLRVPEERREVRHQLRSRLAWAGLGSLGGGVWLTPHVEREGELAAAINGEPAAGASSFTAQSGSIGDPRQLVGAAWNLERVSGQYRAFIEDFARVRASTPAGLLSPADAARARVAQVPVPRSRPARRAAARPLATRARPRAVHRPSRALANRGGRVLR